MQVLLDFLLSEDVHFLRFLTAYAACPSARALPQTDERRYARLTAGPEGSVRVHQALGSPSAERLYDTLRTLRDRVSSAHAKARRGTHAQPCVLTAAASAAAGSVCVQSAGAVATPRRPAPSARERRRPALVL